MNATYGDTSGAANYHSLQLTLERRFSGGLALLGAYTYSHSIDNVPLQQGGGSDGPIPQDIRYRFLDRGTSGFDIKHRVSQSAVYDLPFGHGKRFNIENRLVNAHLRRLASKRDSDLANRAAIHSSVWRRLYPTPAAAGRTGWVPASYRTPPLITGSTLRSTPPARRGQRRSSTPTGTRGATFCGVRIAPIWISRSLSRSGLRSDLAFSSGASFSTYSITRNSICRTRRSETPRPA